MASQSPWEQATRLETVGGLVFGGILGYLGFITMAVGSIFLSQALRGREEREGGEGEGEEAMELQDMSGTMR